MRPTQITEEQLNAFITAGLYEDIREGDHTSLATIPADSRSKAVLKVKDYGVIAGVELAERVRDYPPAKAAAICGTQRGATMAPTLAPEL